MNKYRFAISGSTEVEIEAETKAQARAIACDHHANIDADYISNGDLIEE